MACNYDAPEIMRTQNHDYVVLPIGTACGTTNKVERG